MFHSCSMIIHGTPLSSELLRDADAKDRFWYWRGASGRKYIHSVYAADLCPPLPGATYVLVKRAGTLRVALAAGRLSEWSGFLPSGVGAGGLELHVHLMARDDADADAISADLAAALTHADAARGFAGDARLAA
jgi:hypothetical protein